VPISWRECIRLFRVVSFVCLFVGLFCVLVCGSLLCACLWVSFVCLFVGLFLVVVCGSLLISVGECRMKGRGVGVCDSERECV